MKAILLAGGLGTHLYPTTQIISKHLIPIYDKPMIYYPLSILMHLDIKDILIITAPKDLNAFKQLLGTGEKWGLNFTYKVQPEPKGIAQALILAEPFITNNPFVLILGDNFFYGNDLLKLFNEIISKKAFPTLFSYRVSNPQSYGIVNFNKQEKPISIEEKPKNPKSAYAVTGLYFYDQMAFHFAKELKPSARGELEISEVNQKYLEEHRLNVIKLAEGFTWFDMGSYDSILETGQFVQLMQKKQGYKIACPE